MISKRIPFAAVDEILYQAERLLIDFDSPIWSAVRRDTQNPIADPGCLAPGPGIRSGIV